ETLWRAIERLAPLSPSLVSVTYGAGGSTPERTPPTLLRPLNETRPRPAAHPTRVAPAPREGESARPAYADAALPPIVPLRGDPAGGIGAAYQPHPGGYADSAALVAGIGAVGDFEISVAAYPEKHPESPSIAADIDMLKRKVDAGARRAITQFFFDND